MSAIAVKLTSLATLECMKHTQLNQPLNFFKYLMVYSHWLGPEPGLVLCRTFHIAPGLGRMGCMVLIRTFHTAPEQGQRRTLVFITGNIFRT